VTEGALPGAWHGIQPVREKSKNDIYRDLLPLLHSRQTELLDLLRLATQLTGAGAPHRTWKHDSIGHAPGSHDDVANCVAGSLLIAHAAAPALWRQEALMIEGAPSPMPVRCDMVFAVLITGQHGTGSLFCVEPILSWSAHAR
jgi:hypothetical protein